MPDLLVLDADPLADVEHLTRVAAVFRQGVRIPLTGALKTKAAAQTSTTSGHPALGNQTSDQPGV